MIIYIIAYIVFHIICGVLAYGLMFGDLYCTLPREQLNRTVAFIVSMFGPIGLLGAFLVNDSGFYFRWRD